MSKGASTLWFGWPALVLALWLLAGCGSALAPGQSTSGTHQVDQSTETPLPATPTASAVPPTSSETAPAEGSPTAPAPSVTPAPSTAALAVISASATASATQAPTAAATIPASATPPPSRPSPGLSPKPPSPAAAPDSTHEAFIRQVAPWAQAEQSESGVPASFSIALAASETSWGVSPLMKQYNNYMMVSCSQPNEGLPCVRYGNGMWNQYSSPEQAFLWHGRWLRANSGFAEAFKHTDDPAAFTRLVARCYVSCAGPFPQAFYDGIMRIIDQYNLRQFDAR